MHPDLDYPILKWACIELLLHFVRQRMHLDWISIGYGDCTRLLVFCDAIWKKQHVSHSKKAHLSTYSIANWRNWMKQRREHESPAVDLLIADNKLLVKLVVLTDAAPSYSFLRISISLWFRYCRPLLQCIQPCSTAFELFRISSQRCSTLW